MIVDIVIGVAVLTGLVIGIRSGFVRQAVGLLGLVLAVSGGLALAAPVGRFMDSALGVPEQYAAYAGFAVVFFGVYLLAMVLVKLIMSVVKTLQLSGANRMAGAVFGGVKAVALLGIAAVLLSAAGQPGESMRNSSRLYDPLVQVTDVAWRFVADRFGDGEQVPELPEVGTDLP